MTGFCGVKEERRCAGRGQAGGDLLTDMTGLANARHDDVTIRGHDQIGSTFDRFIKAGFQLLKGLAFNADHIARNLDIAFTGHV